MKFRLVSWLDCLQQMFLKLEICKRLGKVKREKLGVFLSSAHYELKKRELCVVIKSSTAFHTTFIKLRMLVNLEKDAKTENPYLLEGLH